MKKEIKILFSVIALVLATVLISAGKNEVQDEYYWYVVDYSVPGGQIPFGATPVFSGMKKTQPDAQFEDGCEDINQLHCLRGFTNIPTLPTSTYDASTPKPTE